jgi:hypothetical protein
MGYRMTQGASDSQEDLHESDSTNDAPNHIHDQCVLMTNEDCGPMIKEPCDNDEHGYPDSNKDTVRDYL